MIDLEEDRNEMAQRRKDEEDFQIRRLLKSYEGRCFLWMLLERAGVYRTTFRGEETHLSAFSEGERNIGLWALDKVLTNDISSYNLMKTEAETRELNYRLGKKDETYDD